MFICLDLVAKINCKKGLNELQNKMEELETSPVIMRTIIGGLRHVHNRTTPAPQSFGDCTFRGGITISSIIRDQADIEWINFLCWRWSVKWKEAQKRHYLWMYKKSARLWTIVILKKLLMIQWDMW